jgi:hypothetical protein
MLWVFFVDGKTGAVSNFFSSIANVFKGLLCVKTFFVKSEG